MRSLLLTLGLALVVSGTTHSYWTRNGVYAKREANPISSFVERIISTLRGNSNAPGRRTSKTIIRNIKTNRPSTKTLQIQTIQPIKTIQPIETVKPIQKVQPLKLVSPVEQYLDSCMSGLEDGLGAMAPEIQAILDSYAQISRITEEPAQMVREVADLIRQFQSIGEKMDIKYVEKCLPEEGYSYINSQTKAFSSDLSQLRASFVQSFCTVDNRFDININSETIAFIGDQLELIADLVGSFGDAETGEKVRETFRYWIEYAQRLTAQLERLDMGQYFRSSDCSSTDTYTVADTMDDFATVLEEIGFENLLEQLGIDLSFDVNGVNFDPLNTASNF